MISDRMIRLAEGGSAIRAMFEEGKRLADLYGRENVFDFSIGNPFFEPPAAINEAIIDIVTNSNPNTVHGYPANAGYPEVRSKIADSLNRRHGTSYDENNVVMTVGAAGGLNVALRVLLNPNDEVILISPYFFEYNNYIENSNGKFVIVPADAENGFMPDIDAISAAITHRTKAIIINNPNNPAGVVYSAEIITKLGEVLEARGEELGTTIYMLSDEPYRELAFDGVEVPWLPNCYKNTIVGYSWSKSLSLPGERIGYLLVPSDMVDGKLIFDASVVANRMMGFVNAPSLMQLVVARCLDECTDIDGYDENRKLLYEGLVALGYECTYPSGAFYLWVKTPICETDFMAKAKGYNILMVPGTSFGTPGYVRLAYCVSRDVIKGSLVAFEKLAKDCGIK